MPPSKGISSFSLEWEELLQTNFLAVSTFLGHLPKRKFHIGLTVLVVKLDKGMVLGGGGGGNHHH